MVVFGGQSCPEGPQQAHLFIGLPGRKQGWWEARACLTINTGVSSSIQIIFHLNSARVLVWHVLKAESFFGSNLVTRGLPRLPLVIANFSCVCWLEKLAIAGSKDTGDEAREASTDNGCASPVLPHCSYFSTWSPAFSGPPRSKSAAGRRLCPPPPQLLLPTLFPLY